MSLRTYVRKSFEISLVSRSTNQILLVIDWLDENGQVDEALDGSVYETFYSQATEVPTAEDPQPTTLLHFSVVHVPGYIPDGEVSAHPGAFLLLMDPTQSAKLQTEWIQHGILDLFGVKADGSRTHLASGNFTTTMAATRDFS